MPFEFVLKNSSIGSMSGRDGFLPLKLLLFFGHFTSGLPEYREGCNLR